MTCEHRSDGSDYALILRGMFDPEMVVITRLLDELMTFVPGR